MTIFVTSDKNIITEMAILSEEVRQGKYIKLRPSILKKARIRAVSSDKTLGQWLEDAIEEKAAREEKETQLYEAS